MAEYIEREVVVKILRDEAKAAYPTPYHIGLYAASRAIDAIPAADVRPVVLCRDCKWWRSEGTICKGIGIDFDADGFCCEGERKDGADMREES